MAGMTPEQRAALWKAGKLDVDRHNQEQQAQEDKPADPQVLAEQKARQDRIDQKMREDESRPLPPPHPHPHPTWEHRGLPLREPECHGLTRSMGSRL